MLLLIDMFITWFYLFEKQQKTGMEAAGVEPAYLCVFEQTRILKKPSSNTFHAALNQFPLWAFPPKIAATRATSKGDVVIIGNVLLERLLALDCAESLVTLLALPFRELLRRASSGLRDI